MFLIMAFFLATADCEKRVRLLNNIAMWEKLRFEIAIQNDWRDREDLDDIDRRIRSLKRRLSREDEEA